MRDLRNTERVLDADKTAEAMTKMLAELRLQRLKLEQEYTVQRRSVSADSPQLKVLGARIASIKDQIAQLEAQMTSRGSPANPVLSDALGRFDRERLDHDLAQKQYVAASAAFQRARLDVESQQIYLTTFLKPVLAEDALYPKRWWLWSIITVICLALWGGGVASAVLVRNHLAI
jgi:capsular polysaccharide transport system permease protein